MRTLNLIVVCALAAAASLPIHARVSPGQGASRVVDRIVARVEGDIILFSQVRELGAFQQLIEGRKEDDNRLLSELVEQWVVQSDAATTHFPQPAKSEVDRELERLAGQFPSPAAYSAKLMELELSSAEVRKQLIQQIYLERYIDYKFRPTVQVEPAEVTAYYQKEFLTALEAKNQKVPPMTDVETQIREVLIQRAITNRVAQWLDETKSHLKIEIAPAGNGS
jgi:hypothetical protein